MVKFISNDYVALLSLVLLVGGIFLFIMVLKTLLVKSEVKPEEEKDQYAEQTTEMKTDTGLSLIEAHLNVLSEDIKEIKTRLNELTTSLETKSPQGSSSAHLLKDQLTRISTKLDAMYNVLSDIAKE